MFIDNDDGVVDGVIDGAVDGVVDGVVDGDPSILEASVSQPDYDGSRSIFIDDDGFVYTSVLLMAPLMVSLMVLLMVSLVVTLLYLKCGVTTSSYIARLRLGVTTLRLRKYTFNK